MQACGRQHRRPTGRRQIPVGCLLVVCTFLAVAQAAAAANDAAAADGSTVTVKGPATTARQPVAASTSSTASSPVAATGQVTAAATEVAAAGGATAWKPVVVSGASAQPTATSKAATGEGAATANTVQTPAATTAATTTQSPAAGAAASGVRGPRKSGPLSPTQKVWKPKYPFPQCVNTTLSYDVSFVGKLQFIQVGSVRYAYHRFGPLQPNAAPAVQTSIYTKAFRQNAPVVFISGWGLQMYMWPILLLQRLADAREVIIFDNMRTGQTTDNSTMMLTIPLMANSTAALITKLGLQQPDIWSWSVGGFVGYALLAWHPTKIGNVIIAAGSPGGPNALMPPTNVEGVIAKIEQNYTALLPYMFPRGAEDPGVCAFYAAYNSFYVSKYTGLKTPLGIWSLKEQGAATAKFFQDPTVINKLDTTVNRVLIMHGVQDRLVPVRNALLGVWKLLGAWMLQFPGEGHAVPFSNLQAVIVTTLQFFSLANPLDQAEIQAWDYYGDTHASRASGLDDTLVVQAETVAALRA